LTLSLNYIGCVRARLHGNDVLKTVKKSPLKKKNAVLCMPGQ